MLKSILFTLVIIVSLSGCQKNNTLENEISKTKVSFQFIEFHKEFFNASSSNLHDLKNKYPYLFPPSVTDSIWLQKITKSDEQILYQFVDSVFPNLIEQKKEITDLYKHVKYYKPSFKAPKTITLINNIDYENSIIYADSLAIISLDMYLGRTCEVYNSFPSYLSRNFSKERITADLADKVIDQQFKILRKRSFLESMVYFGKKLYLKSILLPKKEFYLIQGVSKEKQGWAEENESQVWKYFISNELLFSTDKSLNKRFIDKAPFSKFYFESDKETPGSIGTYIGYKIVLSFMKNNDAHMNDLLALDAQTILSKSKYKPLK